MNLSLGTPRAWMALLLTVLMPAGALASEGVMNRLDLTTSWVGYASIAVFVTAYALVMAEEFLHLRKSKPVILAAGIIWLMIGLVYAQSGDVKTAEEAIRHNILEYGELFLFLLVAMTYINAMEERRVFGALKSWLVSKGYTL
ncbi:MAG: sodium:proton antiporter NhaD, partial [Gammaproteobacteria bacterium]|nr:sodium:proton antiporter NhaD [Gammaproteobacteria bacterium]